MPGLSEVVRYRTVVLHTYMYLFLHADSVTLCSGDSAIGHYCNDVHLSYNDVHIDVEHQSRAKKNQALPPFFSGRVKGHT